MINVWDREDLATAGSNNGKYSLTTMNSNKIKMTQVLKIYHKFLLETSLYKKRLKFRPTQFLNFKKIIKIFFFFFFLTKLLIFLSQTLFVVFNLHLPLSNFIVVYSLFIFNICKIWYIYTSSFSFLKLLFSFFFLGWLCYIIY